MLITLNVRCALGEMDSIGTLGGSSADSLGDAPGITNSCGDLAGIPDLLTPGGEIPSPTSRFGPPPLGRLIGATKILLSFSVPHLPSAVIFTGTPQGDTSLHTADLIEFEIVAVVH
jgi:hypothetical protein